LTAVFEFVSAWPNATLDCSSGFQALATIGNAVDMTACRLSAFVWRVLQVREQGSGSLRRSTPWLPPANWLIKLVDMTIEEIGAFEAKTRLSELLERVSRGHVYRITRRGKPIAELRPIEEGTGRPRFGSDRGRVVIADDFDAPLPEMQAYTR
jgi:prevent-host-death family protein